MCNLWKGRKSNWGAGSHCGTSIVGPCILLLTLSLSVHTHSHTHPHTLSRLIDQIDLHMTDGANFSPFPPLANLWPLIYTGLNLYTLIMLSCSLALSLSFHTHIHTGLLCGLQCSALTHAPAVSAQVARKYKNMLKDSGSVWSLTDGFVICVLHELVIFEVYWVQYKVCPQIGQVILGMSDVNVTCSRITNRIQTQWSFCSLIYSILVCEWFLCALCVCSVCSGASPSSADSQVVGGRSREQILQTLSDLSRGFQDIADRCLLVLHLEVRYAAATHWHFTEIGAI